MTKKENEQKTEDGLLMPKITGLTKSPMNMHIVDKPAKTRAEKLSYSTNEKYSKERKNDGM